MSKPDIVKIRETRWTQPDGRMGYQYDVWYRSGRRIQYNFTQTLPMSVVNYLLSEDRRVDVKYITSPLDGHTRKVVVYE